MRKSSEMRSKQNRLPRLRRARGAELAERTQAQEAHLPGMRLTTRDVAILLATYHYRIITSLQLQALFFSYGSASPSGAPVSSNNQRTDRSKINTRCQYRLQLLYHHGYLTRDEQPQKLTEGRRPFIYSLDEKGARLVEELLDGEELDWNPRESKRKISPLFLDHLIASNDVRAAITVAARRYDFKVLTWLDERTLKRRQMADTVTLTGPSGTTRRVAVVPDGYFLLDTGAHLYSCFLEIDRATSTASASMWGGRDWVRKVAVYLEYYRSGKYQERYKTQGLRILTVTIGEKRLANLKAATEKAGGRSRFWFTTFERIRTSDVLTDPIWQKAGDGGFHTLVW